MFIANYWYYVSFAGEWISALDKIESLNHAQLSPRISDLVMTTIPGSSNRPGSTYVISTG